MYRYLRFYQIFIQLHLLGLFELPSQNLVTRYMNWVKPPSE